MPKNTVSDPITDHEVAFARLILSGTMNDRRLSPSGTQLAAPPVKAQIYNSAWRREQQHQPVGEQPGDPVAPVEAQPDAPQAPEPETPPEPAPKLANDAPSPNLDRNHPSLTATRIIPEGLNRVRLANAAIFDAALDTITRR
jgi:hypothetical protein